MVGENTTSVEKDFIGPIRKNQNSPKKRNKIIHAKNQKIRRLQATIKKLKSAKKSPAEALENALSKLPNNLANFIKSQLKLHGKKKQGRTYSPELKSLAISIYHASGKAYRLLSKLFILPTKSSLHRYISKMPTVIKFMRMHNLPCNNTSEQKVACFFLDRNAQIFELTRTNGYPTV